MKQWLYLCCLMLAIPGASSALEDGLYWAAPDGSGTKVPLIEKEEDIWVGEKLTSGYSMSVISTDNGNERFEASILMPEAPKPVPEKVLVVDGKAIKWTFQGADHTQDGKSLDVLGFAVKSRALAERVAKSGHTRCKLRRCPNAQLVVRFETTKSSYAPGEKVTAKITIRNNGGEPVYLQREMYDRGPRSTLLEFTQHVHYPDTMVATDVRKTNAQSSKVRVIELQPGTETQVEEDLSKWFTFKKGGLYKMLGMYQLVLFADKQKTDRKDVIWREFRGDTFFVDIEKPAQKF